MKRLLEGEGYASPAQRLAAFNNSGLDDAVGQLVTKIVNRSFAITDDDVIAAKKAGLDEDRIFEMAVCAAVGQATRQQESALAALDAAMEDQHASPDSR
ncbi:MAG: hypothetical protein JST28_03370 [Acidobacteria bacterium]|nr:hypothetical protein [Acidobacteriota bacterium]